MAADLPAVLRSAELLMEAGETELAQRLLTRESCTWLREALGDGSALVDAGLAVARASGRLNRSKAPLSPKQLW